MWAALTALFVVMLITIACSFVWIAANVSISPGSRIGDGAIVALGSVVRGDVPSCAIVAGNPARVVGWRDSDVFHDLLQQGAFA